MCSAVLRAKAELLAIRVPDNASHAAVLFDRRATLRVEMAAAEDAIESMTAHLSTTGVSGLCLDTLTLWQWLDDVGLLRLKHNLVGVTGEALSMMSLREIEALGISFPDATELQLRVFLAERRLAPPPHFPPPSGSILSWGSSDAARFLEALGDPFRALAVAGWTGPCLCSLTISRVTQAAAISVPDAKRLFDIIREKRMAEEGEEWSKRWSGIGPVADDV